MKKKKKKRHRGLYLKKKKKKHAPFLALRSDLIQKWEETTEPLNAQQHILWESGTNNGPALKCLSAPQRNKFFTKKRVTSFNHLIC